MHLDILSTVVFDVNGFRMWDTEDVNGLKIGDAKDVNGFPLRYIEDINCLIFNTKWNH